MKDTASEMLQAEPQEVKDLVEANLVQYPDEDGLERFIGEGLSGAPPSERTKRARNIQQ